jgi:O-antigen ligase
MLELRAGSSARPLPAVICGLAGLASGVAVALAPAMVTLAAMFVAALAIAGVAIRRWLRWHGEAPVEGRSHLSERAASAGHAHATGDRDHLRISRILYYLALLLMGYTTLRPVLSLSLSDWVFFLALLTAIAQSLAARESLRFGLPIEVVLGTALFVLGGFLSSLGAQHPWQSLLVVAKLTYLTLVWFWLGNLVLRRPEHLHTATLCWVIAAAASGVAGILQWQFGDIIPGGNINQVRMSGFTDHVNEQGALLGIAFIPALYLATQPGTGLFRTVMRWSLLAAVVSGLLLSGSISGTFAAAAGLFLWLSALPLRGRRLLRRALFAAAGLICLQILNASGVASPVSRLATSISRQNDRDATFWTRLETYGAAFETIQESPIVGVGLDPLSQLTDTGYSVHNLVLGSWYQGGLFALLGLLLILLPSLLLARATIVKARSSRDWLLGVTLFAAFTAFLVNSMAEPNIQNRYKWAPLALLFALRTQERRARAAQEQRLVVVRQSDGKTSEALTTRGGGLRPRSGGTAEVVSGGRGYDRSGGETRLSDER